MKKLVALVAVLALATLANAGMIFQAVGGNTVNQNSDVTIQVLAQTNVSSFAVTVAGTGSLTSMSTGTVNSLLNAQPSNGTQLDGSSTNFNVWIKNAKGGLALGVPALTAPVVVYTFTLHTGAYVKGGANTITIDDFQGSVAGGLPVKTLFNGVQVAAPGLDQLQLTVTPEPMTLALLGLGGLFLRRKTA